MKKHGSKNTPEKAGMRGLLVAGHIDFKVFADNPGQVAISPLTLRLGDGNVVLFRHGVLVFCNVPYEEEARFLGTYKAALREPLDVPEVEEVDIRVDPEAKDVATAGVITLRDLAVEKIQLVAEILSKSLVLAYYEKRVSRSFDSIETIAENLKKPRFFPKKPESGLLSHIGDTLLCMQKMIGRVEVSEKPEVLWERPELERLYMYLEDDYELGERHTALERKLDVISRTLETVLGLSQHRHSNRLEWYIIILIVVEIILTLYELFLHPKF